MKEYRGIQSARGPLVFLEPKTGVQNGEIVELRDETGLRRARVIRLEPDHLVAQVFEGTSGIERDDVYVRYTGDHFKLELSPDILGRTFSGIGQLFQLCPGSGQ